MARRKSPKKIDSWLDSMSEGELRRMVSEVVKESAATYDWFEARRVTVSDNQEELLDWIDSQLVPMDEYYGYKYAKEYKATVVFLEKQSKNATPGLLPAIELALTRLTGAILFADDSGGHIADLIYRLMESHVRAALSSKPPLSQAEQTRLVKWLVEFRYGGKQDFFGPDILKYAPSLSAESIAQYRSALDRAGLGPDDTFPLRQLAILARDPEAIIATHGGEPQKAHTATILVTALRTAGFQDLALHYARIGVNLDTNGWEDALVTLLVEDLVKNEDPEAAVALRREWFTKFPSRAALDALQATSEQAQVWEQERPAAEARFMQVSPADFTVYLIDAGRGDEAWEYATNTFDAITLESASSTKLKSAGRSFQGGETLMSLWQRLCAARAKTHPVETIPHYRAMIENTLRATDKKSYSAATNYLGALKRVCAAAGPPHDAEFEVFLAKIVAQNRRRPACIDMFRVMKLI